MAPGKTHVKDSKLKKKFQVKKKDSSGVKKTKNNNVPKKKLKERTLLQIEEVNRNFTAVHESLIKDESQVLNSKFVSEEKQACIKNRDKKPVESETKVTQEDIAKTLENIANL